MPLSVLSVISLALIYSGSSIWIDRKNILSFYNPLDANYLHSYFKEKMILGYYQYLNKMMLV